MSALPRLLLAEDDDGTRLLLTTFFTKKGFDVVGVTDGWQAAAVLRSGEVDVAVLDVMMPGQTGMQVVEEARDAGIETPIIIATAHGESEAVVHALSVGADDYVTKPFDLAVLHARVLVRLRQSRRPGAFSLPPSSSPGASGSGPLPVFFDEPFTAVEGAVIEGRYELLRPIGQGSFGVVWRARHKALEQDVAVKLLNAEVGTDAGATTRLDDATPKSSSRREARSDELRLEGVRAARVQHPHAVRVFDVGVMHDGTTYLVMELLDGPTVEEVLKTQRVLSLARSIEILVPVVEALAAAHAEGVNHRDVKPANVMLHRGSAGEVVKVLDFGVAKLVDVSAGEQPVGYLGSGAGESSSRIIAGSPAYLAPERLRGTGYDGRADVYAVGVMLYELITGRVPFFNADNDLMQVALMHIKQVAVAPSVRNPALSSAVDDRVMRLLAKDPAQRPTAAQAVGLLKGLLEPVV
ncbi:MAG TPA: response regulator [Myxococcota bacterium]